jgi:hypothetical protein
VKNILTSLAFAALALTGTSVHATGLATCESGPKESWQSEEALKKVLSDRGWKVNRVKEDGGCYEVYAINEKGQRVEAYFHPKTLEFIPTERGKVTRR